MKKSMINIRKMLSVVLVSSMLASSVSTSASFIEEPETEAQARLFKGSHLNEIFKMLADDPDTSLEGKDTKITAFKLASESDPIPDTAMSIAKDGDVFAWYVKDEAEPEETEGSDETDIPTVESEEMVGTAEEMVAGEKKEETDGMTIGDAVHVDGTIEQEIASAPETGNVLESETYLNSDTFMTVDADEEHHESLTEDVADITHIDGSNEVELGGDEAVSSEINTDPVSNSVEIDNEKKEINLDNSIDDMDEEKDEKKAEKIKSTIKVDDALGEEPKKVDETIKVDDALGSETKETKVDETIKVDDVLGAETTEEETHKEEATDELANAGEISDKTEIGTEEKKEDTEVKAENTEVKAEDTEVKIEDTEIKTEDTEINVNEQAEIKAEEKIEVDEDAKIDVDANADASIEVDNNHAEPETNKPASDITAEAGEIKAQDTDEKSEEKSEITDVENTEVKKDVSSEITEDASEEQSEIKDEQSEIKDADAEEQVETKDETEADIEKTEVKDEVDAEEKTEDEKSEEKAEDAESEKTDEKSEEEKDEEKSEESKEDEKAEELKEDEKSVDESKEKDEKSEAKDEESEKDEKSEDEKSEAGDEETEKEDKSEEGESEEKSEDVDESEEIEDDDIKEGNETEDSDIVEIKETGVIYIRASVPVKMNKDSSYLFYNLEALEDIGPFADFDFSEVKDASYMFAGTKADLSKTVTWNPVKLEKAEGIFDAKLTPGWYTQWLAKKEAKEEEKKKEEVEEDVDVNDSLIPADRVGTEELQALLENSTAVDSEIDSEVDAIAEIMKHDPENEALKQMAAIESGITAEVIEEVQEALDDKTTAVPEEVAEAAKNAGLASAKDVKENKKLLDKAKKGANIDIAGENAEKTEIDLDTLKNEATEASDNTEDYYDLEDEKEPEEIELVHEEEVVELVDAPQEEIELVQEQETKSEPEEIQLVEEQVNMEPALQEPEQTEELVQSDSVIDKVLDIFSTDVYASGLDDNGNSDDEGELSRQKATSTSFGPRDTLEDSMGYLSTLFVSKVQDGAAPWDLSQDTKGNDDSPSNNVVRSYDDIVYTLTYATALTKKNIYNTLKNVKMYVSYEVTGYSPDEVSFNRSAMPWMNDVSLYYSTNNGASYKLSTQVSDTSNVNGIKIVAYRKLPESGGQNPYSIPGTGTINCVISVKGVQTNKNIRPTFKAWLETATNKTERNGGNEISEPTDSRLMIEKQPPNVKTTSGIFFQFAFNKTSTNNRTFERHSENSTNSTVASQGYDYMNGSGATVRDHGRIKQCIWNINIAKSNGTTKGCSPIDPNKNVTVRVGLINNNTNASNSGGVGMFDMRTQGMTGDKMWARHGKNSNISYLTSLAIKGVSDSLTGQGVYVSGSLSATSNVFSFQVKPGSNIKPGSKLTTGEFLMFSEQDESIEDDTPTSMYPHYEVVIRPKSISGYPKGVSTESTITIKGVEYGVENTIEPGGGWHAHMWLNKDTGGNIAGSSYSSTSGIMAYTTNGFRLKNYQYCNYTSKELNDDTSVAGSGKWKVEHSRKLFILWDNRYVDIDVENPDSTSAKLKFLEFSGELKEWEANSSNSAGKLARGYETDHTRMVFITKGDGSEWSNDTEMYNVKLFPRSSQPASEQLRFFSTYKDAKDFGSVCGVVVENFNYTPLADTRTTLGITFGMKFKSRDAVVGKTVAFTHSIMTSHWDKMATIASSNTSTGLTSFRLDADLDSYKWINRYAANISQVTGKPTATQVFWFNGEAHEDSQYYVTHNYTSPNRLFRPTNWSNGIPQNLTGHNHPHEGTSLYVLGDENSVTNAVLKNSSITDIQSLADNAKKTQLTATAPSLTKDLSSSNRVTFAINPGWQTSNKSVDLDATLFIPTPLKTKGKDRTVIAEKNNSPMEYLYAGPNAATGSLTRIVEGQTYNVGEFVSGASGTFTISHQASDISKFVEGNEYKGNPYMGRTFYIIASNGKALAMDDDNNITLETKANTDSQKWEIVPHSSGAYCIQNVDTGRVLTNGGVGNAENYATTQNLKTASYKPNSDDYCTGFRITGNVNSAKIYTCIGDYMITSTGSGIVLKEASSNTAPQTWDLQTTNTTPTTGFVVTFKNLKNAYKLPIFYTEYFLDRTKLDATTTVCQNTFIVENNKGIEVSTTNGHASSATLTFVDLRAGVIKETVDKNIVSKAALDGGTLITYTISFNNIYDDQRYMNVKCTPASNGDTNGTKLKSSTRIEVVPGSLEATSSLGADGTQITPVLNNGSIYAQGIMEPSEMVQVKYSVRVTGSEGDEYIRNNSMININRVANANGTGTTAIVDANEQDASYTVYSNRVETYIEPRSITSPPITITTVTQITTAPPGISKEVNRQSNNVGEDHTWTITAGIPSRSDYPTSYDYEYDEYGYEVDRWRTDADLTSFVITDTIDNRLDYRGGLKVYHNNSDITVNCSVTHPSMNFAGGPITVRITNSSVLENMALQGGTIRIVYNTRINMTCPPHTKIYNQANLSYTGVKHVARHSTTSWSGSGSSNQPFVYTGETKVEKRNILNDDLLKGATISIYTADGHIVKRNGEYPVNYGDAGYDSLTEDFLVDTDDEGVATFYGLKDGTYYFRETKPPRGFEWNKDNSDTTALLWGRIQGSVVQIMDNPYQATTVEKSVEKNEWLTHEVHTWTVTGHIPQYFTDEEYAECKYIFIDEIDYQILEASRKRLDYRGNVKVYIAGTEVRENYDYRLDTEFAADTELGIQRVVKLTVTMLPPGITKISDAAKDGGWETNTVVFQYDTSINERAHEHEIIPNRVELNYSGFGVRRYAKSDLRIVPSENPLDLWSWERPERPGYPFEYGEPGGHLVKTDPEVARQKDAWLIDDPYVYTPYRELRINCIIDRKYDPYEDISFTYDIDGYPCYDKSKKLHWTIVINPNKSGTGIPDIIESCSTPLIAGISKYNYDTLIYLPPGTYTVSQREPMRYDLVESKPEVTNAEKVPGSYAIRNNLIAYRYAEDTFVNVLTQWNMHSSAYLEKNEPGLRPVLRGYLNVVLLNGPKSVRVVNAETDEEVFTGEVANAHCVKIDYGTYYIYADGSFLEQVNLQQYSIQRRYALD